jgi:hypothetical protein
MPIKISCKCGQAFSVKLPVERKYTKSAYPVSVPPLRISPKSSIFSLRAGSLRRDLLRIACAPPAHCV